MAVPGTLSGSLRAYVRLALYILDKYTLHYSYFCYDSVISSLQITSTIACDVGIAILILLRHQEIEQSKIIILTAKKKLDFHLGLRGRVEKYTYLPLELDTYIRIR